MGYNNMFFIGEAIKAGKTYDLMEDAVIASLVKIRVRDVNTHDSHRDLQALLPTNTAVLPILEAVRITSISGGMEGRMFGEGGRELSPQRMQEGEQPTVTIENTSTGDCKSIPVWVLCGSLLRREVRASRVDGKLDYQNISAVVDIHAGGKPTCSTCRSSSIEIIERMKVCKTIDVGGKIEVIYDHAYRYHCWTCGSTNKSLPLNDYRKYAGFNPKELLP